MPPKTPAPLKFKVITAAEEEAAFSALVDRAFPVPAGAHFLDDFPVWSGAHSATGGGKVRLGAFAEGAQDRSELVACTGVRLASLTGGVENLTVAVIGAVATHERFRGHGLASALVGQGLDWARSHGAGLALLWGSEHSLYRRLGFELCGLQQSVPLRDLLPQSGRPASVQEGWTDGVFESLRKFRRGGFLLTAEDRAWLGAQRNVRWFWTGDAASPDAVAALGRGIDLNGYVHEWGGEDTALAGLLQEILRREPEARLLRSPGNYGSRPFFSPVRTLPEFLCMAAVLDLQKTVEAWYGSRHHQGQASLILELETLREEKGESAMVQALLGGTDGVAGSAWLPLNFWVWGLDAA